MTIRSYRELKVWQQALDLAAECYRETQKFPKEELYGITSQIRRASASIPANIAEGYGRKHEVNTSSSCISLKVPSKN